MGVSFFGAQPLLPLANDFRRQSTDLRAVAVDLDQLAASLAKDRTDVKRIHDHVSALSARVGTVRGGGGAGIAALLIALLVWLGAQAAAALLLGIMLLRRRSHRRA